MRHLHALVEEDPDTSEDGRPWVVRRLLVGAMAVVLAAAATFVVMAMRSSGDDTRQSGIPVAIEVGSVCRSLTDGRYEVSCGTTAFGDTRFNCTTGRLGRCPVTTAVTLRNVGRIPVGLTAVSGEHEGDRRFSPAPELAPRDTITLHPSRDARYLFDILVRSVEPGAGAVQVLAVR